MNKQEALDFVDWLRWIVQSEHDTTENNSSSTSESFYKGLEAKLKSDLEHLDRLEEYLTDDCREIAERVMDALCEDGRGDLLLIRDDAVRQWWVRVQEQRKTKETV